MVLHFRSEPIKARLEVTMLDRLVEIFCEADDFCKTFQDAFERHLIWWRSCFRSGARKRGSTTLISPLFRCAIAAGAGLPNPLPDGPLAARPTWAGLGLSASSGMQRSPGD